MKRFLLLFAVLIIALSIKGQQISFSFTATRACEYIPLDSVVIENLTLGGDTTLYWNDTVLTFIFSSISDEIVADSKFHVSQNYPNPFDTKTNIDVFANKKDTYIFNIYDLTGKNILQYSKCLEPGKHTFKITLSDASFYLLSIVSKENVCRMEMIQTGQSFSIPEISYNGFEEYKVLQFQNSSNQKSSKSNFLYSIGNHLRFKCFSEGQNIDITDDSEFSKDYIFYFDIDDCSPGIENCGEELLYMGYNYKTVLIDKQCWFAENLRYLPEVCQPDDHSNTEPRYYVYDYYGTDVSSAIQTSTYDIYGVLYNWSAAMNGELSSWSNPSGIRGICPPGWYLPSEEDWRELERYLGLYHYQIDNTSWRGTDEGSKIKKSGYASWSGFTNENTDMTGFSALPGGTVNICTEYFAGITDAVFFWTSTKESGTSIWTRDLWYGFPSIHRMLRGSGTGSSIRCLYYPEDLSSLPTVSTVEVTDIESLTASGGILITKDGGEEITDAGIIWSTQDNPLISSFDGINHVDVDGTGLYSVAYTDLIPSTRYYVRAFATNSNGTAYGNIRIFNSRGAPCEGMETIEYEAYVYNTVRIGTQCWLAENLKYMPQADYGTSFTESMYYVYGYYGIDLNEAKEYSINGVNSYDTYGVLYNWSSAITACPPGWKLPSYNDWLDLELAVCTNSLCNSSFVNPGYPIGSRGINEGSILAGNDTLWLADNLTEHLYFDASGFSALPGGVMMSGFNFINSQTSFWSSTESMDDDAWNITLKAIYSDIYVVTRDKEVAMSVRCVRE
jgi:uncharacterized protein (TIGR02145 family)